MATMLIAAPHLSLEAIDGRFPILSEELFSNLLVRERKRSERSNQPFVLLCLRAKGPIGEASLEALAGAIRGTDILGWLERPRVVGVILPEIGTADPVAVSREICSRVRRELEGRVNADAVDDFSLELRVYPESWCGEPQSGAWAVDPIFYPDLRRDEDERWLSDGVKRGLDIVGSVALLLSLAPVFLVAAALVRLTSPGPVLFRKVRIGKLGRPFTMLKFRTMYVDAGESPHCEFVTRFIKESGRVQKPAKNHAFKLTNDPRVTPVGRVLRKTSIDELPQLWNVLTGAMSLVGPRPPLAYEVELYATWQRRRVLEAKPGITGLWQVTGRSRTTFDEMVRLDLKYAKTRSFWTDIRTLLRTPGAVVSGKGAC